MEKITKKLCSTCKYRGGTDQKISCNYMTCIGHSRIFQDGKMAYDPKFCDKFKEGEQIIPRVDAVFVPANVDIYEDYKWVKIRKERSTYAYKNR